MSFSNEYHVVISFFNMLDIYLYKKENRNVQHLKKCTFDFDCGYLKSINHRIIVCTKFKRHKQITIKRINIFGFKKNSIDKCCSSHDFDCQ